MTRLPALLALGALLGCLAFSAQADEILARGTFKDADAAHKGSGEAHLVKTDAGTWQIELHDFSSTPGPDLKVWLVAAHQITSKQDVLDAGWIALGKLDGPNGDHIYPLPEGTSPEGHGAVAIWCELFAVLFSSAALQPEA